MNAEKIGQMVLDYIVAGKRYEALIRKTELWKFLEQVNPQKLTPESVISRAIDHWGGGEIAKAAPDAKADWAAYMAEVRAIRMRKLELRSRFRELGLEVTN